MQNAMRKVVLKNHTKSLHYGAFTLSRPARIISPQFTIQLYLGQSSKI